ncbi:hypothetical protein [Streptomyces sp. NPDC088249]|uniref:hypothetical protein n=1 Tax=Streptomyces sp. NPDC088249 TaxID=3365843 RepID=UPI0037FB379B
MASSPLTAFAARRRSRRLTPEAVWRQRVSEVLAAIDDVSAWTMGDFRYSDH